MKANRAMHEELMAAGTDAHFTEISGDVDIQWNRHDAWDYMFRNEAFYEWLLRQRRTENDKRQRPFDNWLDDLTHWQQEGRWRLDRGVLTCDPTTSQGASWLWRDLVPALFDLRLEFQVNDENCPWEIFLGNGTDGSNTAGIVLSVMSDRQGSGGLRDAAGGAWLQTLTSSAQHSIRIGKDEWNELRIIRDPREVGFEINGWPAVAVTGTQPVQLGSRLRLSCNSHKPIKWRNIRVQNLETVR